ncbi:hypothetical protein DFQ27_000244 [Actinomortierella ambigua]|uniref:Translationally-controlled tumor protein homolog n=1 Tax=Actinomortierella ambigua TaxID=1343610 RepID=A0A9P6PP69_9FUNG|nr:hypothetical protein DFQ27_000244 [Actinomortierella ambigua]
MIRPRRGADDDEEDDEFENKNGINVVNNVVHSFYLEPIPFDEGTYMGYMDNYIITIEAKLMATNPGRVEGFKRDAAALVNKVLGNFGQYEFYLGESKDGDAMIMPLHYRSDGTQYFYAFKDGVKAQHRK